jgi:predicted SAM-dependent methyltransferase
MRRSAQFLKRLTNKLHRLAHGVPRGVIAPVVKNDLYYAYESIFDFLAAFSVGRRTLMRGTQSAYGAVHLLERGAASVTAVPRSPKLAAYGRSVLVERRAPARRAIESAGGLKPAAPQERYENVQYAESEPAEHFQVAIELDPTPARVRELVRHENVLVVARPDDDVRAYGLMLRGSFSTVRRIAQIPRASFDFASTDASSLTAASFEFAEGSSESPLTEILFATNDPKWAAIQLHVGSGPVILPGWVNVDNMPYPGIDLLWGLERGIPFRALRYIFAEHMIEHLTYADASAFLRRCREALRDDGVLRVTTPNLDWVWRIAYRPNDWSAPDDALRDCFVVNRAFHGWGHHFLYNADALTATLHNAGFADVRFVEYGSSGNPDLAGLEHHERYPDEASLPHVLCAEASGRRETAARDHDAIIAEYERDAAVR